MNRKKDFSKYNYFLAFIIILLAVLYLDNERPSIKLKNTKHIYSTQKMRQSFFLVLEQERIPKTDTYRITAYIDAPEFANQHVDFTWHLEKGQEILEGQPSGNILIGVNSSVEILVKDPSANPLKFEVIGTLNGVKLGGSKTARLNEAPTRTELAQAGVLKKALSQFGSKDQIIQNSFEIERRQEPLFKQ